MQVLAQWQSVWSVTMELNYFRQTLQHEKSNAYTRHIADIDHDHAKL